MNNKMNKYYILILLIFMDYGKKLWINKIGKILITIILLGFLIWKFGDPIKVFIDKYFNLLAIIFTSLLIGGFIMINYFID